MVPVQTLHLQLVLGFPRASGDGPSSPAAISSSFEFPPRERGWSRAHDRVLQGCEVSPARAGMVPVGKLGVAMLGRFPRASGDGPAAATAAMAAIMFPPRERGWSHVFHPKRQVWLVSPARAGMVPRPSTEAHSSASFPRASGDGPSIIEQAPRLAVFPPRERGWFDAGRSTGHRRSVSPARAGMVLASTVAAPSRNSFPRASGDGPQ